METSKVGVMSVVDLTFVTDNGEEVVFVQRVGAGISLAHNNSVHSTPGRAIKAYGKGSDAPTLGLVFEGPFPLPLTTNEV